MVKTAPKKQVPNKSNLTFMCCREIFPLMLRQVSRHHSPAMSMPRSSTRRVPPANNPRQFTRFMNDKSILRGIWGIPKR